MTTPSAQPGTLPLNIFVSYSHRDEDLKDELVVHLANLKRQGKIRAWQDRDIEAGAEWDAEIKQQLETAEVILLLISPRFLASDYCYDLEMQRAIERHDAGNARVIPIILKSVDWQGTPFSKLQVLPKDAKPITTWNDQDEAFLNVVQGIRRAVESLQGNQPTRTSIDGDTTSSPSKDLSPSHNLTEQQISLLQWFVVETRAKKLDGEDIWIIWNMVSMSIQDYRGHQGEIPQIKQTTLKALEHNRCIICERQEQTQYRFALTQRAYEIVDSSSAGTIEPPKQPPSTQPAILPQPNSVNSFQQERLAIQQADLQEAWNLKMDQLKTLRQALAIEAGASNQFQLKKQVEAAEAELTELTDKLENIEQALNSDQVSSSKSPVQPQVAGRDIFNITQIKGDSTRLGGS
jgi:hypothetical protein